MHGQAGGKKELLKHWDAAKRYPDVKPFHRGDPRGGGFALHNSTDFDRWAEATQMYAVLFEPALQPSYEPWGILYR